MVGCRVKSFSRFFWKLVSTILVLVGLIAAFVYSGIYNVAATAPHSKPVVYLARNLMIHSARAHAREIFVPEGINLRDSALAEEAVEDFEEMCRTCHGAPGEKADVWMKLHPSPPDLTDAALEKTWTDTEVYWIIKNGIKDSGMMAAGETHEDREVWALTALVRQFLTMSPAQYTAMRDRAKAKAASEGGHHEHEHEHEPSGAEEHEEPSHKT
jgi:hypothetical protein